MQTPFGLLNINKPAGLTSRRVVDHIQRLVKPAKCGHAGTLDPLATGVLVVCVGPATRLIERVQFMPKRYTGSFLLGRSSTTEDLEGEVTELVDPPIPTLEQLTSATQHFLGPIEQRPPKYSALKVNGQRAYELARRGHDVELAPRTVIIHSIDLLEYAYPKFTLDIRCGSGTYIRSLGRDIGLALGSAAVMSSLTRTEVGGFHLGEAVTLEDITRDSLSDLLIDPRQALSSLPILNVDAKEHARIRSGLQIVKEVTAGEALAVDSAGRTVSLVECFPDGTIAPLMNFLDPLPAK